MRRILLLSLITLILSPAASAGASVPSMTELERWFEVAEKKAAAVPNDERKSLAYSLPMDVPREEAIRNALFMIALRPQSPAPHWLVRSMQWQRAPEDRGASMDVDRVADRAGAESFIESLYRNRMGAEGDDAIHWREGLAEHLLTIGRWVDAREVDAGLPESSDDYARTRRAVIEALNGDDARLAKIQAENCEYCAVVARSLAARMNDSIGTDRAPALMQELMAGRGWKLRLEVELQNLSMQASGRTPYKALERLHYIRTAPDTPQWAREDATYLYAKAAFNSDKQMSLAMIDCWLAQRGITYPAITKETWQELVSFPTPEGTDGWIVASKNDCEQSHGPVPYDPLTMCTETLLRLRTLSAISVGDMRRARQSVEWMAGIVEKNKIGLMDLHTLLVMYAMMTPDSEDGDRVRRYAAHLPVELEDVAGIKDAVRRGTGRVSEPWEPQASPALVPCP